MKLIKILLIIGVLLPSCVKRTNSILDNMQNDISTLSNQVGSVTNDIDQDRNKLDRLTLAIESMDKNFSALTEIIKSDRSLILRLTEAIEQLSESGENIEAELVPVLAAMVELLCLEKPKTQEEVNALEKLNPELTKHCSEMQEDPKVETNKRDETVDDVFGEEEEENEDEEDKK